MFVDIEGTSESFVSGHLAHRLQPEPMGSACGQCQSCHFQTILARLHCLVADLYDRSDYLEQKLLQNQHGHVAVFGYLESLLYLLDGHMELFPMARALLSNDRLLLPDRVYLAGDADETKKKAVLSALFPWVEIRTCRPEDTCAELGGLTVVRSHNVAEDDQRVYPISGAVRAASRSYAGNVNAVAGRIRPAAYKSQA